MCVNFKISRQYIEAHLIRCIHRPKCQKCVWLSLRPLMRTLMRVASVTLLLLVCAVHEQITIPQKWEGQMQIPKKWISNSKLSFVKGIILSSYSRIACKWLKVSRNERNVRALKVENRKSLFYCYCCKWRPFWPYVTHIRCQSPSAGATPWKIFLGG